MKQDINNGSEGKGTECEPLGYDDEFEAEREQLNGQGDVPF